MTLAQTFLDISIILAISSALGLCALFLRQPLIVAFIVAGIIVGPSALSLVSSEDELHLLAGVGVSILLFVVGLKLDIYLIKAMGKVAIATGVGQVAFTSVFGFVLCLLLGLELINSLYIAVALTFSSTIIIVKLLSDKKEIDSLHGRIAIGLLIVQDILVILAMIFLLAVGPGRSIDVSGELFRIAASGFLFLVSTGLAGRYVVPLIVSKMARSSELLVLFAVAWAVGLASVAVWFGLSKEIGAFLAGVTLASTPYRESLAGRLVPLRDFLLLFFFIQLGSQLELGLLTQQLGSALVLSLFVLIGNPIIVMMIMGVMGYRRRTSFLTGLTVAQISEFSLILAALGLSLGHIDESTMGLITLVGIITIALSTYLILYSAQIYAFLQPALGFFERAASGTQEMAEGPDVADSDFIMIGLGRFGGNITKRLLASGKSLIGIDFDPYVVREWHDSGEIPVIYADAEDPALYSYLASSTSRAVVCCLPDVGVNTALFKSLRESGYRGDIILTAYLKEDYDKLRTMGASHVFFPLHDAAERAAEHLLD